MIGGSIDEHTTVLDTQRLFAAARQPKELWRAPTVPAQASASEPPARER
jgi:hypothetical protein